MHEQGVQGDGDCGCRGRSGDQSPRMIEWFDKQFVQTGLFIYLRHDAVFQVESETRRFHTLNGITEQSLPEDVRRTYTHMEAYELLNSFWQLNRAKESNLLGRP